MKKNEIATYLREIQAALHNGYLRRTAAMIKALERDLPDEDYGMPEVQGFDTVLSFMSKNMADDPALTFDPVRNTIEIGRSLSKRARERGLPILKVAAPAAVTQRYGKVAYVNAYPTHLLVEHFA